MCEVRVFKREGGEEKLLLRDVYLIEEEPDGLRFETIFGEQKVFEGEIKEISLLRHRIVLEKK